MPILTWDSMDNYATTADLDAYYESVESSVAFHATNGRFGGGCIQVTSTTYANKSVTASTTVIIGVALEWTVMDINNNKFLVVDGGAGQHLYFNSLSTGQFEIYVGGTLRATVPNLGANRWHWIDIELFVDDANGHCLVDINGVEYVNITGADTRNAGNANVDRVRLGGLTPSIRTFRWDDLIIADDAGSPSRGLFGDSRIIALRPSSDTAQRDFSSTDAGSPTENYVEVNEPAVDGDTSYVESSTVGHIDQYNLGDLGVTPLTIHGVGIKAVARKDDGGARTLRLGAKSGATTDTADIVLGTTYAMAEHVMELNPDDNEAWEVADVDALLAHIEVV